MKKRSQIIYFIILFLFYNNTSYTYYMVSNSSDQTINPTYNEYEKIYEIINNYTYPMSSINQEIWDNEELRNKLWNTSHSTHEGEEKFITNKIKEINENFKITFIPKVIAEIAYILSTFCDTDEENQFILNKKAEELIGLSNEEIRSIEIKKYEYPQIFQDHIDNYLATTSGEEEIQDKENHIILKQQIDYYSIDYGSEEYNKISELNKKIEKETTKFNDFFELEKFEIGRGSTLTETKHEKIKKGIIKQIRELNRSNLTIKSNYNLNEILNQRIDITRTNAINSLTYFYKILDELIDSLIINLQKINDNNLIIYKINPFLDDRICYPGRGLPTSLFIEKNKKIFKETLRQEIHYHTRTNSFLLLRVIDAQMLKGARHYINKIILEKTCLQTNYNTISPRSISYGNGLFPGIFKDSENDIGACVIKLTNDINLDLKPTNIIALPVKKTHIEDDKSFFYISALNIIPAIYGSGELFHSRTKLGYGNMDNENFINQKVSNSFSSLEGFQVNPNSGYFDTVTKDEYIKFAQKVGSFLFIEKDLFEYNAELIDYLMNNMKAIYDPLKLLSGSYFKTFKKIIKKQIILCNQKAQTEET